MADQNTPQDSSNAGTSPAGSRPGQTTAAPSPGAQGGAAPNTNPSNQGNFQGSQPSGSGAPAGTGKPAAGASGSGHPTQGDPNARPAVGGTPNADDSAPPATVLSDGTRAPGPHPIPGAQQPATGPVDISQDVSKHKDVQDRLNKARDEVRKLEGELAAMGPFKATTAEEDTAKRKEFAAQQPIVIHGRPGGPFTIDGSGFGDAPGTVLVGGRALSVTRWNDRSIKGTLPPDIKDGDIVVQTTAGDKKGTFQRRS
jgi:hypothetical protein